MEVFRYWRLTLRGQCFKLFNSNGYTLREALLFLGAYEKHEPITEQEFLE